MVHVYDVLFSLRFHHPKLSQLQVLFGLSASVNVDSLAGDLLSILSKESPGGASSTVASSEYKLRTTVRNFFEEILEEDCLVSRGVHFYLLLPHCCQ